jgi:hypothetical protein
MTLKFQKLANRGQEIGWQTVKNGDFSSLKTKDVTSNQKLTTWVGEKG